MLHAAIDLDVPLDDVGRVDGSICRRDAHAVILFLRVLRHTACRQCVGDTRMATRVRRSRDSEAGRETALIMQHSYFYFAIILLGSLILPRPAHPVSCAGGASIATAHHGAAAMFVAAVERVEPPRSVERPRRPLRDGCDLRYPRDGRAGRLPSADRTEST